MEHVKPKPPSDTAVFFQALAGFAVATLVMIGIGGTVYSLGMAAVLAFIIAGACIWLVRGRIPARNRDRYSELFVYGFAAAGALYFAELLLKGGL